MMSRLSLIKYVLVVLPLLFVISLPFSTQDSFGGTLSCIVDPDGANDFPNQKDFTNLCEGTGSEEGDILGGFNPPMGVPALNCEASDLLITWSWDDIDWSGANTGDACSLYDTDGDQNANLAFCVTVSGDPAMFLDQRMFICDDNNSDRCKGDEGPTPDEVCTVDLTDDDPFAEGEGFPVDTKGACCFDVDNDLATGAVLIAICSYPSRQPNSSPSDCQVAETTPPEGCNSDGDCNDSNICTEDICNTGEPDFCTNGNIPGCCIEDADCDDSVCDTEDLCVDNQCQNNVIEPTPEECLAPSPTVIIPTMGQWGMMLAAVVLGIFAIIRIRSLKDSELS